MKWLIAFALLASAPALAERKLDYHGRDDDEAVRLMNDSPYGLTAAIWTRDQERAFRIGAQIETGTFFMNRCDYLDPLLPWTGVKDTGKGMSLSRYGFLPLTRRKSFHLRTQT